METQITEAELAQNVTRILDRVCEGEQFIVVRDGKEIAVLSQARPSLSSAVQEAAEKLKNLTRTGDSPEESPAFSKVTP